MSHHFEEEKHPISLSFSDLSLWCYECDSYIVGKVFADVCSHYVEEKFSGGTDVGTEIEKLVE